MSRFTVVRNALAVVLVLASNVAALACSTTPPPVRSMEPGGVVGTPDPSTTPSTAECESPPCANAAPAPAASGE